MQPSWDTLSLEDRARKLARQGFGFLTSDPVRVVYQPKEGEEDLDTELVDVPKDGKTIGEIVTRGNITMKEVSMLVTISPRGLSDLESSTSKIQKPRRRHSMADTSTAATLRWCIRMGM